MLIIWKNRGNMNNFGEIIKDIRKKNNLTQKELADKLSISQSYISRIEKKVIKKLKNLMKI